MSPLFSTPAESPFITGAYVPCLTGCGPNCCVVTTPARCEIYDYGVLKCCPAGWDRESDPDGELCTLLGQQEYLDSSACLDANNNVQWFSLPTPNNENDCKNAGGIWYPEVNVSVCPSPEGAMCGVQFKSPLPSEPPCYNCEVCDALFLNCYVVGFSGKLGLGPTESSITIELVERGINPPCDGPCSPSDPSNPLTDCFPAASSGPPLPSASGGSPVPSSSSGSDIKDTEYSGMIGNIYTFSLGNFCFTGVLSNHQYSESSDGYRYSVTLTDGRNVLSKTMVLIKGYYDNLPVELKPNVINIGYKLSPTVGNDDCGDGSKCTDFAGGYGDQDTIQLAHVINALNGEYCQMPISGTFLRINLDEIINIVNLSEYTQLLNKLEEDHLSVIDLVVKATEDIGYDFYVEIIGNEIVFKPINRSKATTGNDLFNLLTDSSLTDACSTRNYGQELTFNATKRLVRGQEMTYFAVVDGYDLNNPEPSPSFCGRIEYPCYIRDNTNGEITEYDDKSIKSDCLAQNSSAQTALWYGIGKVFLQGSFGRTRFNYGNIIGGPGDTFQSEALNSVLYVDTLPTSSQINDINVDTVYFQGGNYHTWDIATNTFISSSQPPSYPLPTPPNPSCSPYPSQGAYTGTNNSGPCSSPLAQPTAEILMYFGSEFKPDPSCSPACNKTYTTIYVADGEDFKVMAHREDSQGKTYVDYNYSCQELIDAGILTPNFNDGKPYFTLTEMELLHTGTQDGWYNFGVLRHGEEYSGDEFCDPPSFAWLCMKDIGYDTKPLRDRLIGMLFNNENFQKETMSFAQAVNTIVTPVLNYFKIPTNFTNVNQSLKSQRLLACYEWIKNIYDTYYGKKFLIKVADHNIYSPPQESNPPAATKNICLSKISRTETQTTTEEVNNMPLVVSGNGENQGYIISDQVSLNGAFPSERMLNTYPSSLLGLSYKTDINDNFLTNEGNIESFIKFGTVSTQDPYLGLQTPKVFRKYGWDNIVNMSLFNNDNSYLKKNGSNIDLYLRADSVDELFFLLYSTGRNGSNHTQDTNITKDYGGVYALLSIQQPVTLIPAGIYGTTAAMGYFALMNDEIRKSIQELRSKSGANNENFNTSQLFGSKPDYSILNQAYLQPRTLMPQGAAVPLKSNLYSYGPYYHIKDRTGPAEIVIEPDLYPGFFNTNPLDPLQSYKQMHNMGKRLCKDGVNGVQKVETGTYTIHNLPSLSLGYLAGNPKAPVLLNDMSVTFGSGGFSTTYNFETYTPRFGSPARHILDQYKIDKRESDYINSQRRIDKRNILNINRDINLKRQQLGLINNLPIPNLSYQYRSTPHTLLITGYAFKGTVSPSTSPAFSSNTDNENLRPSDIIETYDSLSDIEKELNPDTLCCNGEPLPSCVSCSCEPSPSASMIPSPFPSHSGNIYTITTFAENRNSYDFGHLQETFGNLAVMSVDGLYLPVSIRGGILEPQSSQYPNIDLYNKSISRYGAFGVSLPASKPKIPVFEYSGEDQYNLSINNKYLNPIISRVMLVGASPSLDGWDSGWDDRRNGSNLGFVINSIAFGEDFDKFRLSHNVESEFYRQDSSDFRFNAMRGPLVLQGWGYDTNGKPIPNHADNPVDTEKGEFYDKNLTDKFMKDWLRNPRTWPVGPIDLRFDRERKVWVCPPPDRIILAQLTSSLNGGGSATAKLVNIESGSEGFYDDIGLWDKDGKNIKEDMKNTSILVYDYLGLNIKDKSLIYAYYDGSKYIVLNSRDRTIDDCCWYGLEALKDIPTYDAEKKQALVHKPPYKDGITNCVSCLAWEDIIECSPSPSPSSCPCSTVPLTNFNTAGASCIDILFPFNIKDASVSNNEISIIDPPACDSLPILKLDIGAAQADCVNGQYQLEFDITYKRCCDNNQSTNCTDTISLTFNIDNFATPATSPGPEDCACDTGNNCNWTFEGFTNSNCDNTITINPSS